MFIEQDDGDFKEHGSYKTEQNLMDKMIKMARALGIAETAPKVAIQMNQNNMAAPSGPVVESLGDNVLAINRFAERVVNG